jgi:hypothetical protein
MSKNPVPVDSVRDWVRRGYCVGKVKVKISLLQVMEAHKVARGQEVFKSPWWW